jgi:gliding motility-associated-like protein
LGYLQNNLQNPTIASSTVAMSGVYTVTVTNAAGCSATATTTVVVNANPTPTANNTGPYCAGATIQLNSPLGSGTDDWTGPLGYAQVNSQNPTIAGSTTGMSGVYTVTVTNASGCSATATTTVVVNPLPTPTANNTGPYCAGATIQLNSPAGYATDDWTGPGGYVQNNMQNPTIAGSTLAMNGTYTVIVTAGTGCSATATTTVVVNANPTPTATNTGPYCSGSTIQLNSPLGSGTDDWAGPLGYTQVNSQNPTIAASTTAMSGVYTVTVTNAAGCSATATTTVVVNSAASPSANNTGPYCAGATINLSSPGGAIDYDWAGPGGYVQNNTQNPTIPGSTIAMNGAYTVTITMAGGCTGTASTTVVVNPLPTPTATNTGPYCAGASIQLNSPTGSGTDDWTGPLAYSQNNVQNPTITNATAGMTGVYTVIVTNANGCSATATTSVTVNANPTPTANNTGPYCAGATIQLNSPTGTATDDWTGPGGYIQNNTQNPAIPGSTIAMSGVYTVSVTNANGCNATATTTVVVNSLPTPTANNTGPYCSGTTIQLNSPSGSATDDWSGPSGYSQNNTQNPIIAASTMAMNGVYTVSVTDANGCNATATTTVVVNALPTPFANNTGPYCDGANMDLSSGGGVDYDWSGPAGFVLNNTQNGTIPNANPGMSGTYTVSVTDVNGCNSITTTLVTINGLPVPGANNTSPICEFQNFTLNANGGVDYDWTGPGGFNQPDTQNPAITNAPSTTSGTYTVTVTDANGCVSTATTIVVIHPNITLVAGSNSPICSGAQLDLNAQPIAGANYNWTGPNGFNVINQQNPNLPAATTLASGNYTVLATNGNGCTGTATVNVTVNPLPIPQFSGDVLVGCAPLCVNFTDLSNGNGSAIATWNWNVEGQNPSNIQHPSFCFNNAGIYDASLLVTSTDGCSATISLANYINVSANPVAQFDFTPKEIDIDHPEVTFGSTSTGATNWNWLFGDGGSSILENPIHMYQDTGVYCILLSVSNNVGCTDTATGCLYIAPVFNLFIPNAFTPNEDGLNEVFNVYGTGVKSIIVRIFDRWGEELFSFDSIDKGWTGSRSNGEPCKQDVYVYRIEVVDSKNDFHEYMGSVNLIR